MWLEYLHQDQKPERKSVPNFLQFHDSKPILQFIAVHDFWILVVGNTVSYAKNSFFASEKYFK